VASIRLLFAEAIVDIIEKSEFEPTLANLSAVSAFHFTPERYFNASIAFLNVCPDIAHASYVDDCSIVAYLGSLIFPAFIRFST